MSLEPIVSTEFKLTVFLNYLKKSKTVKLSPTIQIMPPKKLKHKNVIEPHMRSERLQEKKHPEQKQRSSLQDSWVNFNPV